MWTVSARDWWISIGGQSRDCPLVQGVTVMATRRYELNLATMEAVRIGLTQSAMAGNDAAADELERMITNALVFAFQSMGTSVHVHEMNFRRIRAGLPIRPRFPEKQQPALMFPRIRQWFARTDWLALLATGESQPLIESFCSIPHLAATKATFTAGCLGYRDCPCFDVHMSKLLGIKPVPSAP